MAEIGNENLPLVADFTYQQYKPPLTTPLVLPTITGDTTVVTTINGGGGGQATGPAITLGSNWSGINFIASSGNVNIEITNAANARAALGAAASGVNADITQFTALTGNGGFNAWTGTPDQASHATFSGTASVGYVQAELQAVMDSLQQATGLIMALLTALLASGIVEN